MAKKRKDRSQNSLISLLLFLPSKLLLLVILSISHCYCCCPFKVLLLQPGIRAICTAYYAHTFRMYLLTLPKKTCFNYDNLLS